MNDFMDIMTWMTGLRLKGEEARELIVKTGLDPIFNQQTPAVTAKAVLDEETIALCRDILVFAQYNKYLSLAGLASNQLGKNGERVMLNACFINEGIGVGWTVALNPKIVGTEGVTSNNTEGCLTWPKKQIKAVRHAVVTVSYLDLEGKQHERREEGFQSIVWQHEINHLDGVPESIVDPYVKIKPNSPCECGSGKKFKKCCGRGV